MTPSGYAVGGWFLAACAFAPAVTPVWTPKIAMAATATGEMTSIACVPETLPCHVKAPRSTSTPRITTVPAITRMFGFAPVTARIVLRHIHDSVT